jgi:MATE family, multidrug efflux pump
MRPYRSVLPAFQAAGRPLWPLIGITSRAVVVSAGGWSVAHLTGAGLDGLAAIAAAGLAVYGASLAIAFRAGFWRTPQPRTAAAAAKS